MGLSNTKKLLLVTALGATVLSCILAVNKPHSIEEYGIDFDNQTGIALKGAKIGNAISEGVSVSSIYSQMGLDENDNYCLRFATAIAGDIESVQYVREGIEGINDGASETIEVSTVYKAILADGLPTYFDADNLEPSTSDAWAGSYYWACYTIRFNSSKYYNQTINVSLKVNDEDAGTKSTSLSQLANGVLKYSLNVQEGYVSDTSDSFGKFESGSIVNLTATKTAPSGKHIAGWYNVENDQIVSKDPLSITMPNKDITVAPYADATYIDPLSSVDAGVGKLDINNYLISSGGISENTWQGKSTIMPKVTPSVINNEGGKLYTKSATTSSEGEVVDAVKEGRGILPCNRRG